MNKNLRILVIVIIVVIVAGFAYVLAAKPSTEPTNNQSTSATTETSSKAATPEASPSSATEVKPGTYTEYSAEKLAAANGQTVLFFHAPWCPQCRSIEAGIVPEAIPLSTTIFKVDYDSNQDLRKKYGVTLQTTFIVLDKDQNAVKKHVAYDKPTFDAVKQAIFE